MGKLQKNGSGFSKDWIISLEKKKGTSNSMRQGSNH